MKHPVPHNVWGWTTDDGRVLCCRCVQHLPDVAVSGAVTDVSLADTTCSKCKKPLMRRRLTRADLRGAHVSMRFMKAFDWLLERARRDPVSLMILVLVVVVLIKTCRGEPV